MSGSTDPATCEFCAIARGDDSSVEVVCEEEDWIAFFPLNPATPGHTLIIPRLHVADLWRLEPPLTGNLMDAVVSVGRAIDSVVKPEGMNLISSAGETAEQSVFHLHLHLVPRWEKDGFGRIWPPDGRYEDAGFDEIARRIRQACV